jgi:hypothetical protein
VTYGRQLLVAARSTQPAADVAAALEAAAAGAPASKELRPGLTVASVLARSELRLAAHGPEGPAVAAVRSAPPEGAYEALQRLLAAPPPAGERGVAIAATIKYLVDRAPVELAFSTAFEQTTCVPLPDRPFAVVLSGANIDKDLYVWLENGGASELLFYSNQRQGGSVDLTQALARHGAPEGTIEMKLGNGDCFGASGSLAITVDGAPRWSAAVDKGLSDCGWQLDARVKVSSASGEVDELLRWVR